MVLFTFKQFKYPFKTSFKMSSTTSKQKLALRRLENYSELNPEKFLPKDKKRVPKLRFEIPTLRKNCKVQSK